MSKPFDPVAIAADLVRIPSESSSPVGNYPGIKGEGEAMLYVSRLLDQVDIKHHLIEILPGRPNLYAHIPAPGKPKLILDNHLDTVSGKNMALSPFGGEIKEGKLWGRGACDVKGAAGALLAAVCNLKAEGLEPAYDIRLAFTIEEETGFTGAAHAAGYLMPADLVIVLEPTRFDMVISHKGVLRIKVTTHGKAAHGSTPERGENAIYKMMEIIEKLKTYHEALQKFSSQLLGSASLSINQIQGGSAFNIIPDTCSIEVDIRTLPDMDMDETVKEISSLLGKDVTVETVVSSPGLENLSDGTIRDSLIRIQQEETTETRLSGVAFGTDACLIQKLGPCLIWGPGDIKLAHTKEEYILTEDIQKASNILKRFFLTPP